MQAVGMAPTSNYAMWGSAGYPVMPTNPYPYPPGAQVETPAQSHPSAGNSVYNTPLAMPTAHTHAQMVLPQSTSASLDHVAPSHAPIPLPMVELRGPPTAHAGTEAPPQPSAHTPFVAGTLTSSPLSIIPELRGLQALSSTQSRIIALPGSRRSSMRQSSLDSNYPTPPVNINRGVHFAPRVQILVHSPPLSPVIDSPTSSASDLTDASSQADSLSDECDVIPSPTCSSTQDLPSDPGNNYSDDSLLALAVRASDERGPGQDVNDSYDRAASLQQLRHVLHTTSGDEGINYVASPMTLPETAEVRRHGTASPSAQPTTAPPSTPHNQARDPSLPSSPPLSSLPISDIPVLPVFTFQSFSTPPSVTPQPTQLYSHGYQPPPTVPLPESFSNPATAYSSPMPNVQGAMPYGPNMMYQFGAHASPNGFLYHNGAAAAGFGIGTPYRPHLSAYQYNATSTVTPDATRIYAYRGSHRHEMSYDARWDDAHLLEEMRKTYNQMRSWRRWFSLKNVRSITFVSVSAPVILCAFCELTLPKNTDAFGYPQRIGPARVSTRQHMRLRFLLDHPEVLKGRTDFIRALSESPGVGIEFVERWQARRLALAVLIPVALSLIASLVYAGVTKDVSTAFTIGCELPLCLSRLHQLTRRSLAYITSAFSVILVLIGILGLVDL